MEFPSVIPLINPSVIKKYYYRGIYRQNGADKFIFLLSIDLPTEKKITDKKFTGTRFNYAFYWDKIMHI
jgi:hypothetical protein